MLCHGVVVLCLALVCMPMPAVAQQHYKLNVLRPGNQPPCFGLDLSVLTVTQTRQDLIFRIGIFNTTEQDIQHSRPLATNEVSLKVFSGGRKLEAHPTTTTLTDLFPSGPLRARSAHTGVMTFSWGSDELDAAALGMMELRVPGFDTVYVRLDPERRFKPVVWTEAARRSPLNIEVVPESEAIAIFPMRLHSLLIKEDALEVALSFRNGSRFPVTWNGKLGGQNALLVTEHGERLAPLAVSDSLGHRLAPQGKAWNAGEDNVGWIRFPLPNPLAADRLGFLMPGYGVTFLKYDPESREWMAALRAKDSTTGPTKVEVMLDEERTFDLVKRFWESASQSLGQRDWPKFFTHFQGDALHQQQISIDQWRRAPIATAEYKLSEFQRVKPDASGRLMKVRVDLRYTLASLPAANEFMTQTECDMQRGENGRWYVKAIRYPELQPFWQLGYTEALNSERFLVFYRAGEGSERQAELAIKQLEKGYARLVRTGLPLKARYAAFSIGVKDDFARLTGRDPLTFTGAASSGYLMRDGQLQVVNEALYLNDFRFFTMQRAWGRQDRQSTIQHELVHLALADLTRPWTPAWLTEGAAMYYAEQCDSASRAALKQSMTPEMSLVALSRLSHLGANTGDTREVLTQYQYSGEAVSLVVRQRGEAGLLALYSAYAASIPEIWVKTQSQGGSAQASARLLVARRTLAKVFPDLTLEGLDAAVRQAVE